MKKVKLPIPNGYKKALKEEIKPNMQYWLSSDGRENHFRNIAMTYGSEKYYTDIIDSKIKRGVLYIEKK